MSTNIESFDQDPNAAIGELLQAPTPITWRIDPTDPQRTLDAATAQTQWQALREWVEWLVTRYALDHKTVPPCWYLHGAVVDELTALWGAWQLAYWPLGSSGDPVNWMQIFANTRMRLGEWCGRRGCRDGDHRPDRITVHAHDATWDEHVSRDCAARAGSAAQPRG